MTEQQLLDAVLSLAKVMGWRTMHARPAMRMDGSWRTAGSGDVKGWPDVFAVRGDRCIAIELKSETGAVAPEQRAWINALEGAGISCWVWRPSHWTGGQILQVLQQVPVTSG